MIPVLPIQNPPVVPPPVVAHVNPLKSVWRKICEIARRIFDFLCFWNRPSFILSKRQIAIIDNVRFNAQNIIPPAPPLPNLDFEEKKIVQDQESTPIDPSLKNLLSSLEGFGSVISECVKSEKIAPSIELWKEEIGKIPETTKQWVKMILDLKKYLDPIFDKFDGNDDPLFMTLIQLLCSVLLEKKARGEIEKDLIEKINELQVKKNITDEMQLKLIAAIQPTLNWLIQSNNMFLKSINPLNLHNLLIDTRDFTVEFSNMLLDGELDPIIEEIQALMDEHLDESLEKLLDNNHQTISRLIGTRLVYLIQNMSYTPTFDDLTDRINTHLQAWKFANVKYKEEKVTIITARDNLDKVDATTKQKLEEYIQIIDDAGGEKEYLSQQFIANFREVVAAKYPDSVSILDTDGMPQKMVEDEVYGAFAHKLYKLLLPSGTTILPLDIHIEQDGLMEIWEQIALPEMLEEVQKRLHILFESVLKKIQPRNEDNFKSYFYLILKTFIFYYVRENKIIPLVKTGIERIFEKFSNPDSLDQFLSLTILPAVSDKLFQIFAKQVITKNVDLIAPFFCTLIETPSYRVPAAKNDLIAKFEELLEKDFKDFKWEMIDRSRVPTLLKPIIMGVTDVLRKLKAVDPTKLLDNEEVAAAMKQLYKDESDSATVKKEFGEIIGKLLFDIAGYQPTWGWFHSWFEGKFAEVASEGFRDFRTSFHSIVDTVVNSGSAYYLNHEYVRTTFFDVEKSLEEQQAKAQEVKQALPDQFLGIAAQTHDLMYWTPETKTLNEIIQKIVKRVFKRNLINKNLVFQFFKVLEKSLGDSVIRTECSHQLFQKAQLISE